MYCEWYGVCDFVVLSVVEVCADYGGVNVFPICLNFGVVYGVGVCVNVCGVITERSEMGLYDVHMFMSLFGFGIGMMFASFHV